MLFCNVTEDDTMLGLLRITCCTWLLYAASPVNATTVFRCEDSNGHVTYTQQGCPEQHSQDLQNAYNPTPGTGKPVAMATRPKAKQQNSKSAEPTQGVTVVGERQDGCGNRVTGTERRQAIIREQARSGMTRADVESALGKPDKVTGQNGQTRYHYQDSQGNRRQVSFDEAGCVKGKP